MHAEPFPRVDERLVEPETRQEVVRGVRMIAQPANPDHGDRHTDLDYVTRAHVAAGYVVSCDLLTRFSHQSDFATDVCVRKDGDDPETGARYLEELAFEIVNQQSLRHITIRAEDIVGRGVRRLIAIFVKRGTVAEWSRAEHRFVPMDLDGTLEDPTLARPIPIRALLDATSATRAVTAAVWERDDPWVAERKRELERQGLRSALLLILDSRDLQPNSTQQATIEACTNDEQLARWLRLAVRVSSVTELLDG